MALARKNDKFALINHHSPTASAGDTSCEGGKRMDLSGEGLIIRQGASFFMCFLLVDVLPGIRQNSPIRQSAIR